MTSKGARSTIWFKKSQCSRGDRDRLCHCGRFFLPSETARLRVAFRVSTRSRDNRAQLGARGEPRFDPVGEGASILFHRTVPRSLHTSPRAHDPCCILFQLILFIRAIGQDHPPLATVESDRLPDRVLDDFFPGLRGEINVASFAGRG